MRIEKRILARAKNLVRGYIEVPRPLAGEAGAWRRLEVHGWAQYLPPALAAQPVAVKISLGRYHARALANYARDDLAAAGIGNGRHAFRATLHVPADAPLHRLTVRSILNGQKLDFTEDARTTLCNAPSRVA
jgi:hypothetical protein